jgi:hypothetical protein
MEMMGSLLRQADIIVNNAMTTAQRIFATMSKKYQVFPFGS